MPKYYLEQYDDYYPDGGLWDIKGPFDSIDEAKANADTTSENLSLIEVKDNVMSRILRHTFRESWTVVDELT